MNVAAIAYAVHLKSLATLSIALLLGPPLKHRYSLALYAAVIIFFQ